MPRARPGRHRPLPAAGTPKTGRWRTAAFAATGPPQALRRCSRGGWRRSCHSRRRIVLCHRPKRRWQEHAVRFSLGARVAGHNYIRVILQDAALRELLMPSHIRLAVIVDQLKLLSGQDLFPQLMPRLHGRLPVSEATYANLGFDASKGDQFNTRLISDATPLGFAAVRGGQQRRDYGSSGC